MKMQSVYKSSAGEKAVMALYDTLLAQWPVPHETFNIPTQYGNSFVIASGEKSSPAMVLLHGAGTNSAIWARDVSEYGRYYRVYAVDLLGEPGKSAPARPPWEGPAYAEWLEEVLDKSGIKKTTLAGISQGAWTALKLAVKAPERVEKLVLISPGGIVPDQLSFLWKAIPLSLLGRWGMKRMIRLLFAAQPIPDGVEEVMRVVNKHFRARLGILPIFSDEELKRLTMPVFLLGGNQDALRDMTKIAARLKQHVPCLTTTILPGGGHALLNTAEPVLAFLRT